MRAKTVLLAVEAYASRNEAWPVTERNYPMDKDGRHLDEG